MASGHHRMGWKGRRIFFTPVCFGHTRILKEQPEGGKGGGNIKYSLKKYHKKNGYLTTRLSCRSPGYFSSHLGGFRARRIGNAYAQTHRESSPTKGMGREGWQGGDSQRAGLGRSQTHTLTHPPQYVVSIRRC